MAYKYTVGQPYIYPKNDLSLRRQLHAHDVRHAVRGVRASTRCSMRALDRIFILHADHEQNASTSTVRLCGSSGTNPFAAIAAGVACLWGPAHGGANEAALNMLDDIQKKGGVGQDRRVHQAGQGQELRRQADGLRPPRVQELRPARQADAAKPATKCWASWAWRTTRCSSWPWRWRRSRWKTNTSSRASSTRTSTSTPASCSAPSASRCSLFTAHLRAGPHRRLDRPAQRDDRRPRVQDRPPAPAVHRLAPSATCKPIGQALNVRRIAPTQPVGPPAGGPLRFTMHPMWRPRRSPAGSARLSLAYATDRTDLAAWMPASARRSRPAQ